MMEATVKKTVKVLRHYVRRFQEPYLAGQVWLYPHLAELSHRNHV
jgi:uncharacterized protein YbgA (DUF1722 family)